MPMPESAASDWATWIPHAGAMCLLDSIACYDAQDLHALARVGSTHPLASVHGVHVVHLLEYGAQACAVHGALLAHDAGRAEMRPGRLVSVRELRLAGEYVDSTTVLNVHVSRLYGDDSGAQYSFRVEQAGHCLAHGRVAVIHPPL